MPGIVEIDLYPTNLLELMEDDIQKAIEDYNEVYTVDEEVNYEEIERLYDWRILEIMQFYADLAQPVSEPEKQLYWDEVDTLLMENKK